ncbi:hypothetical protein MMC11_004405 [Xylographa trunciseda]|nr:hypothetical protein [Xylographa trunciseda]
MAVAIQSAGMSADTGPNVHPFFTVTRSKGNHLDSSTINAKSFVDNSQIELRSPVTTTQSTTDVHLGQSLLDEDPSLLQNRGRPNVGDWVVASELKQSSHLTRRANKKDRKKAEKALTAASANKGSQSSSESGERLLLIGTAPNLEIDPNDGRRKRRRTASTEPNLPVEDVVTKKTWEEQLQAAAASASVLTDNEEDRSQNNAADVSTKLLSDPDFLVRPEKLLKAEAAELPTLLDRSISTDHETPILKNETPKKKMLKLRNDGRLASPKSGKLADIGRLNSKGRGRRKQNTTLPRILVLRYGSDSATKSSLGQSINSILESPVASKKSLASTGVSNAVLLPGVATKVTHPFFLGKILRQTSVDADHDAKSATSEDKALSRDPENFSPKKKVSTVSPTAAKAWAAIAENGFAIEARSTSKFMRFAGAMEPLWPPQELQHCRGPTEESPTVYNAPSTENLATDQRRLKTSELQIHSGESILDFRRETYRGYMEKYEGTVTSSKSKFLRKPCRRLMTGREIQDALRPRLVSWISHATTATTTVSVDSDVFHNQGTSKVSHPVSAHSALRHVYDSIATSLSGFDRFECETRDWTSKYSPQDAASVLQQGPEVTLLRDWLTSLTVMSVNNGTTDVSKGGESSATSKRLFAKRKKRRKRGEDLEDFVVSSDGELDEMDELAQPATNSSIDGAPRSSMIRSLDRPGSSRQTSVTPMIANAVVISGPHGCGKTAAVYAVAQELGFEVFEINAGSRRSGKDVLDKVGDMTRNHLIRKAKRSDKVEDTEALQTTTIQEDISSGRQSTMQSFLKPETKSKPVAKSRCKTREKEVNAQDSPKKKQEQKQSLILLEEVDILFDEDKLFWTTVLSLILQSRRPIIMTCTDESLLPLDDMLLHAIFRLAPPPDDLAIDYLMLMAGNEGHLISREALSILYQSKQRDIRASITELNFWCQMAVGDSKGGLEWMLIRANAEECHNQQGEALRVVSDGTYMPYMGFLSRDQNDNSKDDTISYEIQRLAEASHEWDYNIEEWDHLFDDDTLFSGSSFTSRQQSLQMLRNFDLCFDAQSAADILQGFGLRNDKNTLLDVTEPELTEKARSNYVEGFHVLQAEPQKDQSNLSTLIPLAINACSKKVILEDSGKATATLNSDILCQHIACNRNERNLHSSMATMAGLIAVAFKSLEEPSKRSSLQLASSQVPFPGTSLPIIVSDIAPYVRSIVAYDIRLEEQRLQLSNLLSHGGRGGKPRRTRASRAALEGGSKAHTRRERWFPKTTNFSLVLQTGGEEWQKVAPVASQQQSERTSEDGAMSGGGSRRSSIDTGSSEA